MARRKRSTQDVPIITDAHVLYVNDVEGTVTRVFRTGDYYQCAYNGMLLMRKCPYVYEFDGHRAFTIPYDQVRYPNGLVGKTVHLWRDFDGRVHLES